MRPSRPSSSARGCSTTRPRPRPGDTASPRGDVEGREVGSEVAHAAGEPRPRLGRREAVAPAARASSTGRVLGTQVMAIISFFIVLLAASLAMTTVKGARLQEADRRPTSRRTSPRSASRSGSGSQPRPGCSAATENAFEGMEALEASRPAASSRQRPARPDGRALLRHGGVALIGGLLASLLTPSMLITLAAFGGRRDGAGRVRLVKATRRLKAFENQLPDVLITLAAALKAGHSFKAGAADDRRRGQPAGEQGVQPGPHRGTPREAAGVGSLGHVRAARLEELRLRDHGRRRSSSRSAAASPGSSTWSPTQSASGSSSFAR